MAQLAPSVQVALDDASYALAFGELDDFHPDRLYRHSDAFRVLRAQRDALRNPATFAATAAALRQPEATAADAPATADPAGDFASLLGGHVRKAPAAGAVPSIDQLVRSLVGAMPAGADPRQAEYVAAADSVIGQRMRAVLHAPAFQLSLIHI